MNSKLQKGFTLIELLVVVTLITLLVAGGVISYTQFIKQSRDAKRRADLENIRSALELYRTNNNSYPTALTSLTGTPKYLNSIPADPLASQGYSYRYEAQPTTCNGTDCTDYVVGAFMELGATCASPPSAQCKSGTSCNYCVNSLGQL